MLDALRLGLTRLLGYFDDLTTRLCRLLKTAEDLAVQP